MMKGSVALSSKNRSLNNLVLTAMFLALGLILPFFTGQIKEIGNMLLPMHLPVMLCGLVCSHRHGLALGAALPIVRSLTFGMPMLFPSAVAMALECATYGFVIGFLFERSKHKRVTTLYVCMIIAMIAGRAVWGASMLALLGIKGELFTFSAFFAGAFANAVPGIILQFVIIPPIILVLGKARLLQYTEDKEKKI